MMEQLVTRSLRFRSVLLWTVAAGLLAFAACKSGSERTEETPPPPKAEEGRVPVAPEGASPDTAAPDAAAQSGVAPEAGEAGHPDGKKEPEKISEEDRKALDNLEKAIKDIDKPSGRESKMEDSAVPKDLLKGLLGGNAMKMPQVQEVSPPYQSGSSIAPGSLPFDAKKALGYLDQLIAFRLSLKVSNERITSQSRLMVDIDSAVKRTATGDFLFEQSIVQTPLQNSAPARSSLKAIHLPSANYLKIADAPWWKYPPNDKVTLERYFDMRLVEKILGSVAAMGRFQTSPVTYEGRRGTRYRVDRKPGEVPNAFASFNPSSLDLGAEIIIDETTGLMLKLDYLLTSKYNRDSSDTAETVSVKLAVNDIGGVTEIGAPERYVDGPKLGGDTARPR